MLPPKSKRPYRSITEPLPRILPIDPLHRESITYPLPAGSVQRRAPTAPLPMTSHPVGSIGKTLKVVNPDIKGSQRKIMKPQPPTKPRLPPLRAAAPSADGSHEDHFNSWMAPFCGNPFVDAGNTCTGLWATCALYGKTHWRLQQIVADKDPQDDAWDSKKGFNSACWAQWSTSFFFMEPFGGILVGLQRSQIRGTYGIDGHLAQDMLLGICLPKCTQMQNDREVRAREGKTSLRKSKDYVASRKASRGTVKQQPEPTPQMKYTPKESTQSESQNHQKKSLKAESLTADNEDHASSNKEKAEIQPTSSFRVLRNEDKPIPSAQIARSRSQVSEREFDGANSIMSAAYSQDEYISDSERIKGKRLSTHRRRSLHGQQLSGVPEERGLASKRASSSEHPKRRNSQSRASLNRPFHPQLKHDRSSYSFALPDCDKIVGTANGVVVRHSPSRAQKSLSYVHDFNDPPLSKTLLEYYEMGDRKSKGKQIAVVNDNPRGESEQHGIRGYMPIISGPSTPQADSDECTPDHSPRRTSQIPLLDASSLASSSGATTPQHVLQDCDSLVTSPEMTRQHSLSDYPPTVLSTEDPTGQYTIEDCISITSSPGTTTPPGKGTDCSECSDCAPVASDADISNTETQSSPEAENNQKVEQIIVSEEASDKKESGETNEPLQVAEVEALVSSGDFEIVENAAEESSEATSQNAEPSKNTTNDVPHALEDCDEDLISRKPSLAQHALEDCDEDLESRKASLAQHTIEDCDEDLVSRKASLAEHLLEDDASVISSSSTLVAEDALNEDDSVKPEAITTPEHILEDIAEVSETENSQAAHKSDFASEDSLAYRKPQHMSEDASRRASSLGSSEGSEYASSNRVTVPAQRRMVTSPTPAANAHSLQFILKEDTPIIEGVVQDVSDSSVSNNENASTGEQQLAAPKRATSPVPSELSATPSVALSVAQQFLAQILAQNQNKMKKTQLDGAGESEESWFDRTDLLFEDEM